MTSNANKPSVIRVTETDIKTLDDLKLFEKEQFQEAFTAGTPAAWIVYDNAVTEAYESMKEEAEEAGLSIVNLMGITALVNIIVARQK